MAYSLDPVQDKIQKFTLQNVNLINRMEKERERIEALSLCEKLSYVFFAYYNNFYYNYYSYYLNEKDYNVYKYNCALYKAYRKQSS